ncbi:MAG: UbiX family flavin prenyltransferase [Chloroflexi bacterium]|nr:UbiX family flavin prenyltransferase [Chloroflexota bacterium]
MPAIVVGITGASGAIYGIRLLEALSRRKDVQTHLVISDLGERIIRHETSYEVDKVKKLATTCYDFHDVGAAVASGSFHRDAMIVAPCSIKTMSALAQSYADNLLVRAGDVTLKERKPLVLLVRETPLHLGHLRNMTQLTEMGAIIFPPVIAFYSHPKTIEDAVNHTVGRLLDLVGLKHDLYKPWEGDIPTQ